MQAPRPPAWALLSGSLVRVSDLLLGRRLRSSEGSRERIGTLSGVALLDLDALSSAAYGPEAALVILIPLGLAGPRWLLPIILVIVAILLAVFASYRQTIGAYPRGGGSYTVAKENLGERWGLLAAAALGVDYVLNVAVGISAGIGALVSAVPALHAHTLMLCLGLLGLLTVINLRGVRESASVFRAPTWTFVICMSVVLVAGVYKTVQAGGDPQPVVAPASPVPASAAVGAWLLVRAFASGCAAMTGVEAVSNGVPLFRRPALAVRTLSIIIGILVALLVGIAILCVAYQIGATDQTRPGYQSVLSQVIGAVFGRGWFYLLTMASIVAVLALSANTSFADFPRVGHLLAADEYLPPGFDRRGRRLVYTQGIVLLASLAATLLIVFEGITDRLIPLFAIGAFLAFTLSQTGMVEYWRRHREQRRARAKMMVNALGALVTGVTLLVLMVSKFTEGAWVTLILVPSMALLMHRLHAHYKQYDVEAHARMPLDVRRLAPPLVVVPMIGWNRAIEHALQFAIQSSPDVRAVQVLTENAPTDLVASWRTLVEEPARAADRPAPKLDVLQSEYREVIAPLVSYVQGLAASHPDRVIEVVVPEMFERRWYDFVARNRSPEMLRTMLLLHGGPRVVVVSAPWYAEKPAAVRRPS